MRRLLFAQLVLVVWWNCGWLDGWLAGAPPYGLGWQLRCCWPSPPSRHEGGRQGDETDQPPGFTMNTKPRAWHAHNAAKSNRRPMSMSGGPIPMHATPRLSPWWHGAVIPQDLTGLIFTTTPTSRSHDSRVTGHAAMRLVEVAR